MAKKIPTSFMDGPIWNLFHILISIAKFPAGHELPGTLWQFKFCLVCHSSVQEICMYGNFSLNVCKACYKSSLKHGERKSANPLGLSKAFEKNA